MKMLHLIAAILCMGPLTSCGMLLPRARVTIEVNDEDGRAVSGAEVEVMLFDEDGVLAGITDGNGRCRIEGRTLGRLRYGAGKEGYYDSGTTFDLGELIPDGVTMTRRYPDSTHRLVLRRKINPVPMYAYNFSRRLPVGVEEVGLDLLKADWVAPHGTGEEADILVSIVTYDISKHGRDTGEITWRFPRKGDGMARIGKNEIHQTSVFRMPHHAPEEGYISSWKMTRDRVDSRIHTTMIPEGTDLKNTAFFFRIRTQYDESGTFIGAMYGKIDMRDYGIGWGTASGSDRSGRLSFTYFVNPDGTRNMEWDPKQNMFEKILRPQEHRNFPNRL